MSKLIDFKIFNGDDAPMPVGTPVTFYDGDPTQSGAIKLGTYALAPANNMPIQDGATENFRGIDIGVCSLQSEFQRLYAVLADDGSHSLPLNLSTQQPDGFDDCTMEDNMSSIKKKRICAEYQSMVKTVRD